MGSQAQLVHLIRLLDDESTLVRAALAKEFNAYGPSLIADLGQLDVPPDGLCVAEIQRLVIGERRRVLGAAWDGWILAGDGESDLGHLESALALVSDFQNGVENSGRLTAQLDDLAEEFRLRGGTVDEVTLARFLFKEKGIEGDRSNYYHPRNSNLVQVIESRRGLPISLACLYMLVGHRLDFQIGGCNWPNHFYARTEHRHEVTLVDCFNGGRAISRESFLKRQGPSIEAARAIVGQAATIETIVGRVLGNLVRAYRHISEEADSELMLGMLQALEGRSGARK
jgi:hypothetical protein